MDRRLQNRSLAGAYGFPKFVNGVAEAVHELRKLGPSHAIVVTLPRNWVRLHLPVEPR